MVISVTDKLKKITYPNITKRKSFMFYYLTLDQVSTKN